MKRHPALVPLSHDHHHALVRARALRDAAAAGAEACADEARRFRLFFAAETTRHFREEEELVFPLLLEHADDPPELLARVLLDHVRIHALVERLPDRDAAAELGQLLEEHVRLEERELFELVQRLVPDGRLAALALAPRGEEGPVARLAEGSGTGPLWGTATDDLNATLLAWGPGEGTPAHVNDERDVLLVVVRGSARVELEGAEHALGEAEALVLPKGARRRVVAGGRGVRYLSVHLRRPGLAIAPAPARAPAGG